MALTEHYYTRFVEHDFYHVYNRTVDKTSMFRNDGNYQFFLKQYDHYLSPVLDTYAFCLLGNHFHLLVRIHDLSDIRESLKNLGGTGANISEKPAHDIVTHQFRKFFQSYAMSFNKQHDRCGTLFQTPFKRALVDSEQYFTQLTRYIHLNPQHHGLTDDFRDWPWSSYGRILIDKVSKLKKREVIEWFGDIDSYIKIHGEQTMAKMTGFYMLEDD